MSEQVDGNRPLPLEDCRASFSDGECVWTKCPVDWKNIKTGADPTFQCPLWTKDTWGNGRDGEEC